MAKAKKVNSDEQFQQIMADIKARKFASIYLLDGDESYYIDKITDALEETVCAEHERDFNQTVMYGKDTLWADVLSACRRYPAFAERQLVVLKEAQSMKDFEKLAIYFENPLDTTVFVVAYKNKTFDGRSAFLKKVASSAIRFTSTKTKEYDLEKWISKYLTQQGIKAPEQVTSLLAIYLGNDLQRIVNELDKIKINVPELKEITMDLVEKYIGISREYNVFELPNVVLKQDKVATFRMLNYFLSNIKDAPLELVIASFYSNFSKLYKFHYVSNKSDGEIAAVIGVNPFFVKDYRSFARFYNLARTEQCIKMLYEYNGKMVGIENAADRTSILKELTTRLFFG